jgi:ABC-type antimicrobial peptide transport system permease subunit
MKNGSANWQLHLRSLPFSSAVWGYSACEIGVRKVLGASVFNLWRLLSREFLVLVFISLLIAIPVSWFYLHGWLQQFNYRKEMSWWIFASSGAGALAITLFTVSYQAIRAALANPVSSLRSE